jgi:ABC-type antimicrobial peptide transport system permease subunit
MSSLSVGVRESSREAIDGVGSDIYVVPDSLNPLLLDLQRFESGWAVIREIENSPFPPSHISPRLRDTLFFRSDQEDIGEVITYGIIPGVENHFKQFSIVKGTWFSVEGDPVRDHQLSGLPLDNSTFTLEVLISEEFSRQHDIEPGDDIRISGRIGTIDPMSFSVKGIYVDTLSQRSESILLHLGELQSMKGLLEKDPMTEILLAYPLETDLGEVIDWADSEAFIYNDIVDLYTKESFLSELYKFTTILDGFSAIVISVTFIVCLIFTATIFMISTKERTIDLSVLRAIGFSPGKVFYLVIQNSLLFYIGGAILGIIFGILLNRGLNVLLQDFFQGLPTTFEPFRVDIVILGWTLISAFLLSIASGLLPALISARRSPIEAIRGDI